MKIISPCFTNNKHHANPLISTLQRYSPEYLNDLILYTDGTVSTDFYHTKMFHAAEAMKNISDEIVILVDAFDVLVNKPLKDIEEEFKKQDCKLLISAEANCFPFKEYESFLASKSNTKLKFPCAGCWIGYREYMIELFESALSKENHMRWRHFTDQGFMETIYYNSFHDPYFSVKIDTEAKIFINTFLLNEGEDFSVNSDTKQLTFKQTNSTPYFIHFNGDGKVHMPLFGFRYCE